MDMENLTGIAVIIFAFGIVAFLSYFVTQQFVDNMVSLPAINNSKTQAAVTALEDSKTYMAKTDYLGMGIFIGMALFIILAGYFSGSDAIMSIVYIIVLVITVALSPILSNTWESVSTASVFGTTVTAFPIINHIILKLPIYTTVIGFMGLVAMYARTRASSI